MEQNYLRTIVFTLLTGFCLLVSGVVQARGQTNPTDTTKVTKAKITDTRKNKPAYLKNGVKVNFVPFKPQVDKVFGNTSAVPPKISEVDAVEDDGDKILNNVKVYP